MESELIKICNKLIGGILEKMLNNLFRDKDFLNNLINYMTFLMRLDTHYSFLIVPNQLPPSNERTAFEKEAKELLWQGNIPGWLQS